MTVFLVEINNKEAKFWPYYAKQRIFLDAEKAIECARENGYDSPMDIDLSIGIKNMYQCGDVNVSIIALEPI